MPIEGEVGNFRVVLVLIIASLDRSSVIDVISVISRSKPILILFVELFYGLLILSTNAFIVPAKTLVFRMLVVVNRDNGDEIL